MGSIRDNGEEHCLSDSVPTSDEDEKRGEPDQTNGDTSIKPTDEHDPRETKEHASGEEQQDRLAAIFPSNRAVVDGQEKSGSVESQLASVLTPERWLYVRGIKTKLPPC